MEGWDRGTISVQINEVRCQIATKALQLKSPILKCGRTCQQRPVKDDWNKMERTVKCEKIREE